MESPQIKPHAHGQFICNKGKNIQWRKDSLLNKRCWYKHTATCTRMKLEHSLTPYTKLKWVQLLSRVLYFVDPWTAAHQASLSITNSQS